MYWLVTNGKIVSFVALGGRGFLLYLVKQDSLFRVFRYWSSTLFSKGRVPS